MNQKQSSSHRYDSYCTERLGENETDALNACIEESSKLNEIIAVPCTIYVAT